MSDVSRERLWNRSFILCLCNNFFLFVYYFALIAVLPIYIINELGGTIGQAGLALTLFLVSSIAIRPFSGMLIEKIGKKNAIRGAGLLFVLFAFSFLCIDSLWSLLLCRFLHGFWFSILTTVNVPIVNDFIPEQRKGEGMGYFVMSTNLGVVFGPLIALTMIQYSSFSVLFGVLAVVTFIGYLFCWTLKIEDEPRVETEVAQSSGGRLNLHDLIEMRVVPISIVGLLTALAYSSITSFITAFAESQQLLSYASLFFIIFAISMIVVRPWVGKLYDQKGPSSVIYPSLIAFALGLVVTSQVNDQWSLWLAAVFIGVGYGSLFPCLQTLAIQAVEKHRMGHAISTFFTLFDLGLAFGSVLMGILISYYDYQMTYLACAVIVIITLMVYRQTVAPRL